MPSPPAQAPLDTPVALMMFNRADLTARVFDAIRQARPRRLFVVADGPRTPAEAPRCAAARDAIRVDWDCELVTNYSEVNLGCKRRVASGISWVFEQCEEAIILEDDTLPSPSFFPFCQALLARYRDDERVMNIAGTNLYPRPYPPERRETYYFMRYGATCGWASWRRAWKHFDLDMTDWPAFKRQGRMKEIFESRAEQWFWTMLFDAQHGGEIDTWDYQWLFCRLAQGGLSATASVNMVANLGFRSDGTHTTHQMPKHWQPAQHAHDLADIVHPEYVLPHRDADTYYFEEIFNPSGAAGLALRGLRRLVRDIRTPRADD